MSAKGDVTGPESKQDKTVEYACMTMMKEEQRLRRGDDKCIERGRRREERTMQPASVADRRWRWAGSWEVLRQRCHLFLALLYAAK